MNLGGWNLIVSTYDDCERQHIVPINDLKEHTTDIMVHSLTKEEKSACWCGAFLNEDGNFVHNALDRREEYESGRAMS